MKRQLINLLGYDVRFLGKRETLKSSGTVRFNHGINPGYSLNGIPVHDHFCDDVTGLPPEAACPHCDGHGYNPTTEGDCRECDGLGTDRNSPVYLVPEEVRFVMEDRKDLFSINAMVGNEIQSLRGPAR